MEWQAADTLPDVMSRPGRCFIRVEGWKRHSDAVWHRVWCDLVNTSSETLWGFRWADMDRIQRDGDMDYIESITHWAPAAFPDPNTKTAPDCPEADGG
jgi:hypothetical protein